MTSHCWLHGGCVIHARRRCHEMFPTSVTNSCDECVCYHQHPCHLYHCCCWWCGSTKAAPSAVSTMTCLGNSSTSLEEVGKVVQ
jgi:hypothetical protein